MAQRRGHRYFGSRHDTAFPSIISIDSASIILIALTRTKLLVFAVRPFVPSRRQWMLGIESVPFACFGIGPISSPVRADALRCWEKYEDAEQHCEQQNNHEASPTLIVH